MDPVKCLVDYQIFALGNCAMKPCIMDFTKRAFNFMLYHQFF